jgi:predicted membrane metal-binding protein
MFKKLSYPLKSLSFSRTNFNLTLISLFLLWWFFKVYYDFITGVDGLGFKAHKTCIEWVQNKGTYDFLNLKILCSYSSITLRNDSYFKLSEIFKGLGLIHLLVASGTHLLILKKSVESFLNIWTRSKAPLFLFLIIFIFCSNFSGPVTRCFVQIIISHNSKKHSMGFSPINLTLMSSLIYLLFFPSAFATLSFWLSVSASLIIALFSRNIVLLSIVFYFVLSPFIIDFSWPQISSILINILLTPILAPLIIVNSALYVLIPGYFWVGDEIIRATLTALETFLLGPSLSMSSFFKISTPFKIIYGLGFVIVAIYFQCLRSNKLFFEIHQRLKVQ